MPKEKRPVGKIITKAKTNAKTKAISAAALTRKRKKYFQRTIRTLKEQNKFYRQLFESQGIPFPYTTGVAFHPITNSGRSSEVSFVQKSILCPWVLEPPIQFEACRILTKLEYQLMERPNILTPPTPSSIADTITLTYELEMPQDRSPNSDRDSTTSSSSDERKLLKKPKEKSPEKERVRHKFSSDKNHELSDNEDNSTMAGIPGSSPDSNKSPHPIIPLSHADDQGDSGIGIDTPISPSSSSESSTSTTDKPGEGVPDTKTEKEAASEQMPPPPTPKATSVKREPIPVQSPSDGSPAEVKEEQYSPSPNEDMDDFRRYESDDWDVLIINVSDAESIEFSFN